MNVQSANQAFYKQFELTPDKVEGKSFYELGAGEWNLPELRQAMNEVLTRNQQFQDFEVSFGPAGLSRRCLLLNARKLSRHGGRQDLILLAIEDITERKHAAAHQDMLVGDKNHREK